MLTLDAPAEMSPEDRALLDRTMDPYRTKRAIYLESASVGVHDGLVTGVGAFAIGEPCYIDDTGHFNAVESLICYNQLMYYSLAVAVRDDLVAELAHWTLDDYWVRQLPDVLIYRQSVTYRRPIASDGFTATFRIHSIDSASMDRNMLKVATSIDFEDPRGGVATGLVDLALVNAPQP